MRHYLGAVLLVAVLCSAGIFALNVIVDPFGVWRPASKPLSAVVIGGVGYSRMAKNHWIRHRQPDLVILGNSHAASAFQAEHFQRHMHRSSPFNMALVGASMEEMLANMRHAYFSSGASSFLVSADMLSFRATPAETMQSSDFARATDRSLGSRYFYLRDLALTSFSPEATARSLLILRNGYTDTHTAGGFVRWCRADATGSRRSQLVNSAIFRRNQFQSNRHRYRGDHDRQVQALETMIEFAVAHELDLKIFIPPFHISYLYALEAADLWQEHKNLVRRLSASVQQANQSANIPLVDFTGFNIWTSEMPANGSDTVNFWLDADHFNCFLAERIIERMASLTPGREVLPTPDSHSEFGHLVAPQRLEAHLGDLDEQIAAWKAANPRADTLLSRRVLGGKKR